VYDARQLDLLTTTGEELNAMTGRDPVWAPAQPNETIQERKPWFRFRHTPFSALGNKKLSKLLAVFFDRASDRVTLDAPLVRSQVRNAIGKRERYSELWITSRADDQFAFGALPDIAREYVSFEFTATFNSTNGIGIQTTTLGCELDFDADPGTTPERFVYAGMARSANGVYAFLNVNRVNVATPINFAGESAIDFHMVVHPQFGLDVGCREPGGTWQTLWSDPDFEGGQRIMLGCGAAQLGDGAQCGIRNARLSCDSTASRQPYLYILEEAACHLDRTELLVSNELGGGTAAPDPAGALAWVNNFVVALNGSPAGAKSKSRTYPNGLIERTRNESLGAMPETVSAKAVSGRVKKAAKLARKIEKLLRKKKLNTLKVRKAIAKARGALDDAQELLIYGVKLP
jgi:hypothetical protein